MICHSRNKAMVGSFELVLSCISGWVGGGIPNIVTWQSATAARRQRILQASRGSGYPPLSNSQHHGQVHQGW